MNFDGRRAVQIDGLRGVAIALVLLFHAYARWPTLVPWATGCAAFPLFGLGWLGVQLFFLISGFVISMSLEKSPGFRGFIYRRWLRLLPAIIVSSLLIYLTRSLLRERPQGRPELRNLLPGFILLSPDLIHALTGKSISPIEGSLWSLFVEAKFYILAGLSFFIFPRRSHVICILSCYAFYCLIRSAVVLDSSSSSAQGLLTLCYALSFDSFGFLAVGCALYALRDKAGRTHLVLLGIVSALATAFWSNSFDLKTFIGGSAIYLLFVLSIKNDIIAQIMSSKIFVFFGLISYPLYLIHENALIALTIKLHRWAPAFPGLLTPILPICVLILLAYVIASKLEPAVKTMIENVVAWGQNFRLR